MPLDLPHSCMRKTVTQHGIPIGVKGLQSQEDARLYTAPGLASHVDRTTIMAFLDPYVRQLESFTSYAQPGSTRLYDDKVENNTVARQRGTLPTPIRLMPLQPKIKI